MKIALTMLLLLGMSWQVQAETKKSKQTTDCGPCFPQQQYHGGQHYHHYGHGGGHPYHGHGGCGPCGPCFPNYGHQCHPYGGHQCHPYHGTNGRRFGLGSRLGWRRRCAESVEPDVKATAPR
jgi:hypothetical protein